MRKFSIFQKIIGGENGTKEGTIKRKTTRISNVKNSEIDPSGDYDRLRENGGIDNLKESILSHEGVKDLVGEDYARGTSVDRRSF